MKKPPRLPWIHLGECPVCVDGLVRVRACGLQGSEPHLVAICDECEAFWDSPDIAATQQFLDAEQPRCKVCGVPAYDAEQSRWAQPEDVAETEWQTQVIFALPTDPTEQAVDSEADPSIEADKHST